MVTAVDFLPWLRPSNDRYHWLVFNQLRDLMMSGGYRTKFACSETAYGANDLSSSRLFSRDSYIYIRPGSYCYAISVWSVVTHAWEPVSGNAGPFATGTCIGEVELIDTNTSESWWRSSQDISTLGFFDYQDTMQTVNSDGSVRADQAGMAVNTWYLPDRRLCLGEGPQQVRWTINSINALQMTMQFMFHLLEPIDQGVNRGI